MKMLKKVVIFSLVLAVVTMVFSCGSGDDSGTETDTGSGTGSGTGPQDKAPDFTSHNTDYSILVRNNTNFRLVAFQGDLIPEKMIGGIPAHATNHGLPMDLTLFDVTKDFPMIVLTEEQYNANKTNLSTLKNTPFTRVYVFYNKTGDNSSVYEIAAGLGGTNRFEIINASNSINVELRINGVAGETIGYAPANILNTTLFLEDGNYNIFPVFKRYNRTRDVVETVYPKGSGSNYAWFQSYSFGEGTDSATMNLKTLLQSTTFTSGAAWVYVNNQTTSGGIRFVEGTNVHKTASGLENIMSGNPKTFQINMPKAGEGNKYVDSVEVANWKFGASGFEVALQTSATDDTEVTTYTIERDKMYTVTVTGSHNDGNMKAYISNITQIPANELGGAW
ncbi:MAG: hypothetical protein LBC76_00660 [Treponema sp.]|jgi:hypothetical protein|nr:hypothetical protein [Treponema sp.]